MIDLNRKTNNVKDETPTGIVILAMLPFVIAFVTLIEVMA